MTFPPLSGDRARALIDRFAGLRALVVGDVILDRFMLGRVTRISPEAPVPVVQYQSEYVRLGGAANVAHNIVALGGTVALVGIVGTDRAAADLRAQMTAIGMDPRALVEDSARRTTEKVRIVTDRNQQLARIDYEQEADASAGVEREILERIVRMKGDATVLVVSDYLKGAITAAVVQAVLHHNGVGRRPPVIIDPKVPHLDCYAGGTLVTPNLSEAEGATHRRIHTDEDAREAARTFRQQSGCDAALVTRGEHGMWLSAAHVEGAIRAVSREVSDVTGAGDTVVATAALALAAGATMAEAALLANHAAGIVVGKFGPATVSRHELLAAVTLAL